MNPQYLKTDVLAGNFSFKNLHEGFLHITRKIDNKKQELMINSEVLDKIEEQITKLLKKIMSENFTQAEDLSACEFCDYKLICNR